MLERKENAGALRRRFRSLKVDGFAVGCFDGVLDRFADRRVGVDAVEYFVIGGLEFAAEDGFDDDLRYIVADHVGAKPFAVFGVEDHFNKAFGMADAGSFTGRRQREFPDFDFVAGVAGLFFRQTGGSDLRACNRYSRGHCHSRALRAGGHISFPRRRYFRHK